MPANARLTDSRDEEILRYRPISKLAVAALICGLLSALAIVDLYFLIVALAGVLLGALALGRIRRNASALIGRKAALCGLLLSILFGAAGWSDWAAYRWMIRREARQFADLWFGFLAKNEPEKAFQLTIDPKYRWPLDETLADYYRASPRWSKDLADYTAPAPPDEPPKLVPTLLALDGNAQPRFHEVEEEEVIQDIERVTLIYEVTDKAQDGEKTFFVRLPLDRIVLESGAAQWWLKLPAQRVAKLDGI
jgi:hypothetical protein